MATNKSKAKQSEKKPDSEFVFGKKNYQFMLIGLVLIAVGFFLMTGDDANTIDGVYDPNQWNDGIFSWRRIRLAPFLILCGFAVEVYAILLNPEKK